MKKLLVTVSIFLMLFNTGCDMFSRFQCTSENAEKLAEKLINAFDNKDEEAVKELLSEKLIAANKDLDVVIKSAFEYYNTVSTSTEFFDTTEEREKSDGREFSEVDQIIYVTTPKGKYEFDITSHLYDTDSSSEGILYLVISNENDMENGGILIGVDES